MFQAVLKQNDKIVHPHTCQQLIIMSYDIEFLNGTARESGVNIIAENMYFPVDHNDHIHNILESTLGNGKSRH